MKQALKELEVPFGLDDQGVQRINTNPAIVDVSVHIDEDSLGTRLVGKGLLLAQWVSKYRQIRSLYIIRYSGAFYACLGDSQLKANKSFKIKDLCGISAESLKPVTLIR